MLILKILGWILLILLGLLLTILLLVFTVLLLPIRLRLSYTREHGFGAEVRCLWLKKQLIPQQKNVPKRSRKQGCPAAALPAQNGERDRSKTEKAMEDISKKTVVLSQKDEEKTAPLTEPVPSPPALRATEEVLKKAQKEPAEERQDGLRTAVRPPVENGPREKNSEPGKTDTEPEKETPAEKTAETDGRQTSPPLHGPETQRETPMEQDPAHDEKEDRLFAFGIDKLGALIKTTGGVIKRVLQSLHYEAMSLTLPVKGKDAADCAVNFGKMNAVLSGFFTLCGISGLRYTFNEVRVFPDFSGEDTDGIRFAITIRGRALWILTAALWAVRRLMKEKILFPDGISFLKKHDGKKDGGKRYERQTAASGQRPDGRDDPAD